MQTGIPREQHPARWLGIYLTTLLLLCTPLLLKSFNHSLSFRATKGTQNTDPPYELRTIVIDAGHGGKDPGCLGGNSREKHIALGIALEFAAQLRFYYPELRIILTRDSDVFIPLHKRAAIANEEKADLFVSIHCNYMPGSKATWGSETYVMGLHTAEHNLEVAKRENEAILLEDNYEQHYDYDPNSAEGHILMSMFQHVYLENSIRFAEIVENHFDETAKRRSRGVKQAGFVVLKETAMPSVLVETGFLSNAKEEAFLLTNFGQQVIAQTLTMAFAEYKAEIEDSPLPDFAKTALADNQQPQRPVAEPPSVAQRLNVAPTKAVQPERVATAVPSSTPTPRESSASSIPDWQRRGAISPGTPVRTNVAPTYSPAPPPAVVPVARTAPRPSIEQPAFRFCVQLAAARKPLQTSSDKWKQLGYLIEVVQENGLFKYQARNLASLEQAMAARAILQQRGFEDAFIVVYRGDERLTIEEYQEHNLRPH